MTEARRLLLAILLLSAASISGAQSRGFSGLLDYSGPTRSLVEDYEHIAWFYAPVAATLCTIGPAAMCYGARCESSERDSCLLGRRPACGWFSCGAHYFALRGDMAPSTGIDTSRQLAAADTIRRLRRQLTQDLRSLSALGQPDAWLEGQLIYYLVADGRAELAMAHLKGCRLSGPQCDWLRLYVAVRGKLRDSSSLALNSLPAASAAMACEIVDIGMLLEGATQSRYVGHACDAPERKDMERLYWLFADPSWAVAGNDRHREHLARVVERSIQLDFRTDSGGPRGGPRGTVEALATSASEIVLTGENDSWWYESTPSLTTKEQERREANQAHHRSPKDRKSYTADDFYRACPSGTAMHVGAPEPGARPRVAWWVPGVTCAGFASVASRYHFSPPATVYLAPFTLGNHEWAVEAGPTPGLAGLEPLIRKRVEWQLPPERYTPSYAQIFRRIDDWQTAFFRRGDSALVVAAIQATTAVPPSAGSPRSSGVHGAFIATASRSPQGRVMDPVSSKLEVGSNDGSWRGTIPARWDSAVVSLESFGSTGSDNAPTMERARFSVAPPSMKASSLLSDILLFDTRATLPVTLEGSDGAIASALATTRVGQAAVGLFWETYGTIAGDSVRFSIRVEPLSRPRFIARMLGRDRGAPVSLSWGGVEKPSETGGTRLRGHAVTVNLAAIPPGDYDLVLSARSGAREDIVRRRITIR